MQDNYVWVDCRWQEPCWLEVFRMRLCGWLPADDTNTAIRNGLFLMVRSKGGIMAALTQKAHRLTDITSGVGDSESNCLMLANVLATRGFENSWIKNETHTHCVLLKEDQIFPNTYRKRLLHEIRSLEANMSHV